MHFFPLNSFKKQITCAVPCVYFHLSLSFSLATFVGTAFFAGTQHTVQYPHLFLLHKKGSLPSMVPWISSSPIHLSPPPRTFHVLCLSKLCRLFCSSSDQFPGYPKGFDIAIAVFQGWDKPKAPLPLHHINCSLLLLFEFEFQSLDPEYILHYISPNYLAELQHSFNTLPNVKSLHSGNCMLLEENNTLCSKIKFMTMNLVGTKGWQVIIGYFHDLFILSFS